MSTFVYQTITLPDNKAAQSFSYWLHQEGYNNKSLSGSMVEVTLPSHGDRFVVLEEVRRRGGTIIEEEIEDDN